MAENHLEARIAEYTKALDRLTKALEEETQASLALQDASTAITEEALRGEIKLIRAHVGRSPKTGMTEEETIRECARYTAIREQAQERSDNALNELHAAQDAMPEAFKKVVAEVKSPNPRAPSMFDTTTS